MHVLPVRSLIAEDGPTTFEQVAELSARVATLAGAVATLQQRVETISTFERLRDVVLARHQAHPCRPPSFASLEARDFMEAAEGIHFLEYGPGGTGFRWTGPGHFTRFTFFVDRSVPVRVRLSVLALGRLSEQDRLSADVDGVAYLFSRTANADVLVAGPVPPRPGDRQTDVLLHVPVLFSPESGSGDARRLGIAITGVALEPVA